MNPKKTVSRRPRQAGGRDAARLAGEGRWDPKFVPPYLMDHLAEALGTVLKLDGPADVLLSAYFRRHHNLGSRDRGFVAETAYFALRHLATIRWRMSPALPERSPRLAALAAVALQYGEGSLHERVVGRDAGALAAILAKDPARAPDWVRAELPRWLYEKIDAQYGDAAGFYSAIAGGAPLDLRVNLLKATRTEVLAELASLGVAAHPTPLSPDGIRLEEKPGLMSWPIYREGRIDVQDEGSQLIARLVAPRRREMVCDFCAGAGGKTLALGALMRSTGSLYAFDVNAKRLSGMVPRLRRSGLTNVHPAAIRDEHDKRIGRLAGKFDRVLVDAPCSGTGTLRRNPDLRWRITPAELERINAVQKSVLESAARLVKAGGRLVYATCSVLREENQAVVEAFLAAHPEYRLLSATEVLESQGVGFSAEQKERSGPWFAMLPQLHGTDGFFGAVLEKQAAPRPV